MKSKKEMFSWIKSLAVAIVIAIIVRQFLFTPVIVSGQSMEPTFEDHNRIILSKIHKIEHSDLVVFHAPNTEDDYIKRVIGLPGDIVVMKDDTLYINGEEVEEPYLQTNKNQLIDGQNLTQDFKVEVPEGQLFVLGDNRRNSTDSRIIGCIDKESVVGTVKFRIFPIKEFGIPK